MSAKVGKQFQDVVTLLKARRATEQAIHVQQLVHVGTLFCGDFLESIKDHAEAAKKSATRVRFLDDCIAEIEKPA